MNLHAGPPCWGLGWSFISPLVTTTPSQFDQGCDIRAPRRCWYPCVSGWSPCGWRAGMSAPAWAETAPSGSAGWSSYSGPSGEPGFNTMTEYSQLNASGINILHISTVQTCITKQTKRVCAFFPFPAASLISLQSQ